jgi:hypothetical protein
LITLPVTAKNKRDSTANDSIRRDYVSRIKICSVDVADNHFLGM